jgi:SET domain-containing protein
VGGDTVTTRERLNTIFFFVFESDSVYLKQIKGEQKLFINDKQIEINENLDYVIRSVNGNVFLDDPIKKTG